LNITDARVREVADLANLELSDDEIRRMSHDLGQILTYIDQLNELNTDQVEPMAQVLLSNRAQPSPIGLGAPYEADETATLREDVPQMCLSNEDALANAPVKGGGYFKVPKVIER
jgi:aspartyl-tRNA(Asn)/glutamyl-tRNA(Gln) amidotransferase subunit C